MISKREESWTVRNFKDQIWLQSTQTFQRLPNRSHHVNSWTIKMKILGKKFSPVPRITNESVGGEDEDFDLPCVKKENKCRFQCFSIDQEKFITMHFENGGLISIDYDQHKNFSVCLIMIITWTQMEKQFQKCTKQCLTYPKTKNPLMSSKLESR